MTIRTVNWCTDVELECASSLPTSAFICVPASIVTPEVETDSGFVEATVTQVRASTRQDSCGPCKFVYTLTYDDTQLVEGVVIVPAYIKSVLCTNCLIDFILNHSGGPSAGGWSLLGNAGTAFGTNFLGTTDSTGLDIRVNSLSVAQYFPHSESPFIVCGYNANAVEGPGDVISGGGRLGDENQITSSAPGYNFIGTGYQQLITGAGASSIVGGIDNRILNSNNAFIGGGEDNSVESSVYSSILNGQTNEIDGAIYSDILGGLSHIISGGGYSSIAGGNSNDISTSNGTSGNHIGGGSQHDLTDAASCVIGGGQSNSIAFSFGAAYQAVWLNWNGIFSGQSNDIGTNSGGDEHPTLHSVIAGGEANSIYGQMWATIAGGYGNRIYGTVPYNPSDNTQMGNTIGGGLGNTITNGQGSCIPGGISLEVGIYSFGFQGGVNMESNPYAPSQVDLSSYDSIAYFGDVDQWIGNTDGTPRKLKLFCPNTDKDYSSAQWQSFEAASQGPGINIVNILPTTVGAIGDVLTINNQVSNTINLEWSAPANTSPMLGRATINLNAAGAQPIVMTSGNYYITDILFTNLVGTTLNAAIGIFADIGLTTLLTDVDNIGLGPLSVTTDVLDANELSGLLSQNEVLEKRRTETTLYAAMDVLEGSAATVDVIMYGFRIG